MKPAPQTDQLWDELESYLVDAKRAATQEIRRYPQPIAGCDAQIPALWDRRDGIVAELDKLAKIRAAGSSDIGAFITRSAFIGDEQKRVFLSRLHTDVLIAAE